jgi:hypothetical protein
MALANRRISDASVESAQQQSPGRSCEAAEALGEKEGMIALKGRHKFSMRILKNLFRPFRAIIFICRTPRVPALRAFTLGFTVLRFQRFGFVNHRARIMLNFSVTNH